LPERAGPNETKQIKSWFREGLDAAGERMTEEERVAVIAEAKDAFKLNIGVCPSLCPTDAR
jgi:heme oxygenase